MTEENKRLFDLNRPIGIKVRTAKGIEMITVRFPTDEEWIERQQKRKLITLSLGRGTSETVVEDTDEIDAALLSKIRVGQDGVEVDGFEASTVFERLQRAELVGDISYSSGQFRLVLSIHGEITTTHVLRMPTAKEENQYRKSFLRPVDMQGSKQQTTINLGAAGELYKKLMVSVDGYAGGVPVVHQAIVIPAVMLATKTVLEDLGPVNP